MPHRSLLAALGLICGISSAFADPWESKRTDFGPTAVGLTKAAPGSTDWNVLAIGLFCARGQPSLYLYGIPDDRMSNGRPVLASVTTDGTTREFSFRHQHDAVTAAAPADFVRAVMNAKSVSVEVKGGSSSKPDVIDMANAAAAIRSALRACFKP